jgi:acetylornithine deacetylase/succinyl-diaminopimelate desuccinylase-like protein
VNGITGGYQGIGGKTVIPATASAKITCRLGPGQDPRRAGDAVESHLRNHCPAWAAIDVQRSRDGTPAYAIPEDNRFLYAIERVIEEIHGRKPLRVGVGGTLPISAMIKQHLGLETVMLSYAIADENIHAPNEFFRLASFDDGLKAWACALVRLAET